MEQAIQSIIMNFKEFDPQNVFNVDECGLFYKLAPERTVLLEGPLGRQKAKDCIKVLVYK